MSASRELDGTEIAVIGLGSSGRAAARLAARKGGRIYVSELRTDPEVAAAGEELRSLGARVELGGHRVERIAAADLVVVSPGIPPDAEVLQELRAREVRWISEPELAFRFFEGSLIAVTGTNGKTTTAALASHLLRESGIAAAVGGNIGAELGPPASELALLDPSPEWFVLEVSSFQLADTDRFRPDVGVVTNLAPDHLDRYPAVEAYYADKARLFRNADGRSRWVLNADDEEVRRLPGDAPGERWYFSTRSTDVEGGAVVDGWLTLRMGGKELSLAPREEFAPLGAHNVANALAASVAVRLAGAGREGISRGLRSFRPLPHRLEPVTERGGVLWVNDSKATNVAAARSAVESLDRPLVVLLGGKDKGEDFRPLIGVLRDRARRVVVYGAAAARLQEVLEASLPVRRVEGSFEEAVAVAASEARSGDAVLLAPACSSYDMFESYEERGELFRRLAREGT